MSSSEPQRSTGGPAPFVPAGVVSRVTELARREEPQTIADQIRLCQIPAPTFHEQRRAAALAEELRRAGLADVRIDQAGNVLDRHGEGSRYVVVSAHLDTVFPEDTPIGVQPDGPLLAAPGIAYDARGLATLIRAARILPTAGTVTRLPGPARSAIPSKTPQRQPGEHEPCWSDMRQPRP